MPVGGSSPGKTAIRSANTSENMRLCLLKKITKREEKQAWRSASISIVCARVFPVRYHSQQTRKKTKATTQTHTGAHVQTSTWCVSWALEIYREGPRAPPFSTSPIKQQRPPTCSLIPGHEQGLWLAQACSKQPQNGQLCPEITGQPAAIGPMRSPGELWDWNCTLTALWETPCGMASAVAFSAD